MNEERNEDDVDMDELIRQYQTDPATLDPDALDWTERAIADGRRMRAAGQFAPPRRPGDNFAIGLDDDFNPLPPVPPDQTGEQHNPE